MAKEIFRQKNLDKVNSPEDLNSYLRVTSPSLIIALISVIILIGGAVFWGIFQKIETKQVGAALNNECYINSDYVESVVENKSFIRIDKKEYKIVSVEEGSISASTLDETIKNLNVFKNTDNVNKLELEASISTTCTCDIVLKSVSPFQFLFNQ